MRVRANPDDRPVGHDGKKPVPLFADEHTEEEWDIYLDRLGTGTTPDLAARTIGLTGTAMSRFLEREPERKAAAAQRIPEGKIHYQERLQATARVLALDTQNPNSRILEVELATHVPGYEHLRRDRVKHEGHVTHGIVIDLDPAKLDALDVEKLRALREALAELGGEVIDAEAVEVRELEPVPREGPSLNRNADGTLAA